VSGVTAKSIVYISSSFLHEMVKGKVVVCFPFSATRPCTLVHGIRECLNRFHGILNVYPFLAPSGCYCAIKF